VQACLTKDKRWIRIFNVPKNNIEIQTELLDYGFKWSKKDYWYAINSSDVRFLLRKLSIALRKHITQSLPNVPHSKVDLIKDFLTKDIKAPNNVQEILTNWL